MTAPKKTAAKAATKAATKGSAPAAKPALAQIAATLAQQKQTPRQKAIARAAELAANAPKSKAAAKPLPVKGKGAPVREGSTASATKPAAARKAVVEFIARTAKPGQIVHVISNSARPSKNPHLFAHTHAALHLLGMLDPTRPAVPKSALLTLLGSSAVGHHLKKTENFEEAGGGVRCTSQGREAFLARHPDMGLANAYMKLFLDGDGDAAGVEAGEYFKQVLIPAAGGAATKAARK